MHNIPWGMACVCPLKSKLQNIRAEKTSLFLMKLNFICNFIPVMSQWKSEHQREPSPEFWLVTCLSFKQHIHTHISYTKYGSLVTYWAFMISVTISVVDLACSFTADLALCYLDYCVWPRLVLFCALDLFACSSVFPGFVFSTTSLPVDSADRFCKQRLWHFITKPLSVKNKLCCIQC